MAATDPNDFHKRLGRFDIDVETAAAHPDVIMAIMGTVIVVRCEMMFSRNALDYVAFSPHFDPVKPEDQVPEYDVNYNGDTEEVTWTRKK